MKLDIKNLKIKMPSLSFLRSKETLGIDLGSTSLKIVQISEGRLVRWAYKELDLKDAGPDTQAADRMASLTQLLNNFMAEDRGTPKAGAVSVSGNSVIVRYVKMAKTSPEELAKSIKFEAEPYIPFNIEEVNLSFSIIGETSENGQAQMETVLVAAKKEAVDLRVELLREAGLQPVI